MSKVTFVGGLACVGEADVVHFGPLRFWEERGLIHVEDARDNSYVCLSVRTALLRMRAISEMLGNTTRREQHTEDQFDSANRKRHQYMLDGLVTMVRRAQEHGTPDDASARRDLMRRRPKTIVVPGYGGGM